MSAELQTSLKSLQLSEKRFRTLFETAPDAILVMDLQSAQILDANDASCLLYGYSQTEIRQLRITDLSVEPTKNLEAIQRGIHKAPFGYHKKRDGTVFPVEITSSDGLAIYTSFIRDISERQMAEAELQKYREHLEDLVSTRTAELEVAKDRAESADRLKSAFLANMSHELRTPLNSIIGFTGIILQGLVGPLNDEQQKQLGMVRGSSLHLLNLINDVLDISKIEAGQLQVVCAPFDMRTMLEKVIQALTPLAENKKLTLDAKIAPEVGTLVSDRRRVEQILINLVNNAVKFTDQGQIHVQCLASDDHLIVQVRDTGMGIKPENMKDMFKPFHQIDIGTARRFEGTGLGLSICQKLAELLGGEIQVASEWGKGSTFTCILPIECRS